MRAQDGFEVGIGKVGSGIARDASVSEFWIDLAGDGGNFRHSTSAAPELDIIHFGLNVMACRESNSSRIGKLFLERRSVQLSVTVQRLTAQKYTGSFGHAEMLVLKRHEQDRFPNQN